MKDVQLPPDMTEPEDNEALAQEITYLEQRLAAAKARVKERHISLSDSEPQKELLVEKRGNLSE